MSEHITKNGKIKSDKYNCQEGLVPLSTKDPVAQPHLWAYTESVKAIDPESVWADDVQVVLRLDGYTTTKRKDTLFKIMAWLFVITIFFYHGPPWILRVICLIGLAVMVWPTLRNCPIWKGLRG